MKFINLSPCSTAKNLSYNNRVLSCDYIDANSNQTYVIEVTCPQRRPTFFSSINDPVAGEVRVRVEELSDMLDINSCGRYRPKKNEKTAMIRGAVLAIGFPADRYKYLITVGCEFKHMVYFSVVVESLGDVNVYKKRRN